ncbi:MAG TPA: TIM barrel protein [Steroidobacteraceae bacterium]|nr:TIM barrel protein [Steroidobacteraceae bacterium]
MLRFSANLSVLFGERPLLERFALARAQGFLGVEMQDPYEVPAAILARTAQDAGVRTVLINAPMGAGGSPGIACRPECRAQFSSALERACEYAAALQVPCVNVLAGRAAPAELAGCEQLLAENLRLAATQLAKANARVLLEPINPYDVPGYCVASFEQAQRLLRACPGVGLQFDIYHAARLGLDPADSFERLLPHIAHVQFADCPGRHEPGTGALAFGAIFAAIAASDYQGWVGAEYRPSGDTLASLGWLRGSARQ